MTIINKASLTSVFETGDVPQGSDFANLIDSNFNLAEVGSQSSAGSLNCVGSVRGAAGIFSSTILGVGVQSLAGMGTVQGTAAVISSALVIATNDPSNYAYILPNTVGAVTWFVNTGANTASVFPPVGSKIDGGSVNAAVSITTGNKAMYVCESATQYRSFAV
jgi:hypothetical protein